MTDRFLIAQLLDPSVTQEQREDTYRQAERDHGKGFADSLRDQVEAHHLIVANERAMSR